MLNNRFHINIKQILNTLIRRTLSAAFLLIFVLNIKAQSVSRMDIDFTVFGNDLKHSVAGGMNAPQFSEVDLNNDGILDLYVFDRAGNTSTTFINEGTANAVSYNFAPEYAKNFPDSLVNFVLLRDYNDDGIHDIFSYSVQPGVPGIAVYNGYYNDAEEIAFELKNSVLYYPGSTNNIPVNLAVLNIDIPDINDIDCDGDLDILTFDIGGGYVDWFRNYSVEDGYGRDSLIFRLEKNCWGGFYESGFNIEISLATEPEECADGFTDDSPTDRHAGSTLLTWDLNNDDAVEIMLGDVSFDHISMLTNNGTCDKAWMTDQDNAFPEYDTPAAIPVFPATFKLDVNNDGLLDLLVSPNNKVSIQDTENVWYYRNITNNDNPVLQLVQKDLFVGEMVDLGTNSNPTFIDYNADGLLDLIVGNNSKYVPFGEKDPRLFLFENVGTATSPAFELVDEDYLNFSQYSSTTFYFSPTVGDLDSDGDMDLLVGEQWGGLYYAENTAGAGNPVSFDLVQPLYQSLDVRNVSRPTIHDLNEDGLMDIIVGERNGILNYFQNYGTVGAPLFYPNLDTLANTNTLGLVSTKDVGFLTGHSAPNFIDIEGKRTLVCGSEKGIIKIYDGITSEPEAVFNKLDNAYANIQEGKNTCLAIADIDNDNFYEMVIGNERGGLSAFNTNWALEPVSVQNPTTASFSFDIFPNPSTDISTIQWKNANIVEMTILNQMGQIIQTQTLRNQQQIQINTQSFAKGFYFVSLQSGQQRSVQKLIVQ